MDFEQFQDAVLYVMQHEEDNEGLKFSITDISKLQGQSYTGLAIAEQDSTISVVVNLDDVYEHYQVTGDFNGALDDIQMAVDRGMERMPSIDMRMLSDYETVKQDLVVQMIPVEGNEARLAEIPHETIGDIAMVYRFELAERDDSVTSVLITDNMLDNYGITKEQLYADAMEYAPLNRPASLRGISEVLSDMTGGEFPADTDSPFLVATVEDGIQGAAVMTYPGFMDLAAEQIGGDFYVLPSSIHEVLFLKDEGMVSSRELNEMVAAVNEQEVDPSDRLSNQAYHYDSEHHILEPAVDFEVRQAAIKDVVLADMPLQESATAYETPTKDEEQKDTITCLLVQPGLYPKQVEMGTELADLQAAVGGYIEVVYPFDDDVGIICNEEGKISGLESNRALRNDNGEIYDILAGDFLIVGLTEDNFGSLTPDQMKKFEKEFHQPEVFVRMGRSVIAVPISDEAVQKKEASLADKPKEHDPKEKVAHKNKDQEVL